MKVATEIKVVGGVIGMLLVLLAFLMYENTAAVRVNNTLTELNNELESGDRTDAMRQEYDRLVLECVEPALKDSDDKWLRELCDETLPALRTDLFGVGR